MILQEKIHRQRGIGLTEVVVGSGILVMILFGVFQFIVQVRELEKQTTSIIRADYLLIEAADVIRILRDNGWTANINSLTLDTNYYLEWSGGYWGTTATQSVIDGKFYRYVQLSAVNRDGGTGNIVTSGGSPDTNTLKVTATVEWFENKGTSTRTFETYTTNLYQD